MDWRRNDTPEPIGAMASAITVDLQTPIKNKANLRDFMAATSLVILLKLDSTFIFFGRAEVFLELLDRS